MVKVLVDEAQDAIPVNLQVDEACYSMLLIDSAHRRRDCDM
jgi:hypothetical protein